MTRVGIVAGILIIIIASVFFGFRKAAREADADNAAGSSGSARVTSASGTASTGTPAATVKRIDPAARQKLLAQIENARTRREQSGSAPAPALPQQELSKGYIRTQIRELVPLLTECYTQALADDQTLAGKLVVKFTIGGEPEVGGLVEASEVDAEQSTIAHAGMVECVRETMYGAEFGAPREGVRIEVRYPFEFRNWVPDQ